MEHVMIIPYSFLWWEGREWAQVCRKVSVQSTLPIKLFICCKMAFFPQRPVVQWNIMQACMHMH